MMASDLPACRHHGGLYANVAVGELPHLDLTNVLFKARHTPPYRDINPIRCHTDTSFELETLRGRSETS